MTRGKGLFVSFDGPNGVGKSSLVKSVSTQLKQLGFGLLQTKEPTMLPLGRFVQKADEIYRGRVLAHLVAADRCLHCEKEIYPALSEGKIVVSDRYIESSLVLQTLDGLDIEYVWMINSPIAVPDLSVDLIADHSIIEQRMAKRAKYTRFERDVSASSELEAYRRATDFLRAKGFNVVVLENGTTSLTENTEQIVDMIVAVIEHGK